MMVAVIAQGRKEGIVESGAGRVRVAERRCRCGAEEHVNDCIRDDDAGDDDHECTDGEKVG